MLTLPMEIPSGTYLQGCYMQKGEQRWASIHANRSNARRRLKTLPSIGRSNRSLFSKNRKFRSRPLSRRLKRFTVVFKSSIFTPLNFFRTIAHSTAILCRRLSNFSTVNLRFFTYVVSKCADFYPHFKYDVLFLIGLFYERCLTSWWGGGGEVGDSQGWSHKIRGDKWTYRMWGV